jgi:hypothetical protein
MPPPKKTVPKDLTAKREPRIVIAPIVGIKVPVRDRITGEERLVSKPFKRFDVVDVSLWQAMRFDGQLAPPGATMEDVENELREKRRIYREPRQSIGGLDSL